MLNCDGNYDYYGDERTAIKMVPYGRLFSRFPVANSAFFAMKMNFEQFLLEVMSGVVGGRGEYNNVKSFTNPKAKELFERVRMDGRKRDMVNEIVQGWDRILVVVAFAACLLNGKR
ncbi:MAG: hypothetical protein GY820_35905 [Gammaproteobacteria bacterium]|nr:hypothetical protein [Gammaproteobacteria bacterium]